MKNSILTHLQSQISLTSILKFDLKSSFLIFIIIFSTSVFSQVVYTDICPDKKIGEMADVTYIDINNDGIEDFYIWHRHCDSESQDPYEWTYIELSDMCSVAIKNDSTAFMLYGDTIDENLTWSDTTKVIIPHSNQKFRNNIGMNNTNSFYLGLKIKENDIYHYAWLRLYYNEENYIWAADFAYNDTPETALKAGETIPFSATSVFIEDVGDYFDGRDIKFSFTKSIDESLFSEYRLIIAKAEDESASNVDTMSQLPDDKYFSIMIDTNDSSFTNSGFLLESSLDKDGEPIENFVDYKAYVLCINKNGNTNQNLLSAASNVVSLQAYVKIVQQPLASDEGNSNSASDIIFSFNANISTNYISEFRAFVIPFDELQNPDPQIAWTLSDAYYTNIEIPTSDFIELRINENQLDFLGNPIIGYKNYQVIILSVPDSIHSRKAEFSLPSRRFYLDENECFYAGQKEGEGVSWYFCDAYEGIFATYPYIEGHYPEWGSKSYEIDLNRDSIKDFRVVADVHYESPSKLYSKGYYFTALNNNKILVSDQTNCENWIEILNEGDPINEQYNWSSSKCILKDKYAWPYCEIEWDLGFYQNQENYYIAFLIQKENNTQFAWLNLSESFYKEYGFIDNTTGIAESNNHHSFHIFPNPAKSKLYFQSSNSFDLGANMSVSIFNSMGIQMEEFDLSNAKMEKNISSYSSGMYFCVIKENGAVLETHKVLIE